MKLFAWVTILLCVSTMLWAQSSGGTDDPCAFSMTVADDGCADVEQECDPGGPASHDCSMQAFHVPCDGCYCIKSAVACSAGDCSKCLAEGWIYDGSGTLLSCCHGPCGPGMNCATQCCYVMLRGGTAFPYTLHACKINCDGDYACDACPATCEAQVTVTYVGRTCP